MRPRLRTRGGQFERRWEGGDTPETHYLLFRKAHNRPNGGAKLEEDRTLSAEVGRHQQLSRQNSHLRDRLWDGHGS